MSKNNVTRVPWFLGDIIVVLGVLMAVWVAIQFIWRPWHEGNAERAQRKAMAIEAKQIELMNKALDESLAKDKFYGSDYLKLYDLVRVEYGKWMSENPTATQTQRNVQIRDIATRLMEQPEFDGLFYDMELMAAMVNKQYDLYGNELPSWQGDDTEIGNDLTTGKGEQ